MPRKTDALERLEKWLKADFCRWQNVCSVVAGFSVHLGGAGASGGVVGIGKTLAKAIHAALDRAEAKR